MADIDAGNVSLAASAWLAGYSSDYGFLRVSFFTSNDGSGTATSSFEFDQYGSTAPAYWQGSANATGNADTSVDNTTRNWSYFSNEVPVAAGTRSVSVDWLGGINGTVPGPGGSSGNDAYADDILVQTNIKTVPDPSNTLSLWLGALTFLGFLRRRLG